MNANNKQIILNSTVNYLYNFPRFCSLVLYFLFSSGRAGRRNREGKLSMDAPFFPTAVVGLDRNNPITDYRICTLLSSTSPPVCKNRRLFCFPLDELRVRYAEFVHCYFR